MKIERKELSTRSLKENIQWMFSECSTGKSQKMGHVPLKEKSLKMSYLPVKDFLCPLVTFSHTIKNNTWKSQKMSYLPLKGKVAKNELSTSKGRITQHMVIYPKVIMFLRPTPFKIDQ